MVFWWVSVWGWSCSGRVLVTTCLAFLWHLGNVGFSSTKTAQLMAGAWLGPAPGWLPDSISAMFLPQVSPSNRGVWEGANGTWQGRQVTVRGGTDVPCSSPKDFLHLSLSLQFLLPETH